MAMIKGTPTAYKLRHPELPDAPAVIAELRGYWREGGRAVGLRLRFPGEYHNRCLTYAVD